MQNLLHRLHGYADRRRALDWLMSEIEATREQLQEQTHALHTWLHRYPQTRQRYQAYLHTIGVSSGTHKHLRVVISEPTQKPAKTHRVRHKAREPLDSWRPLQLTRPQVGHQRYADENRVPVWCQPRVQGCEDDDDGDNAA